MTRLKSINNKIIFKYVLSVSIIIVAMLFVFLMKKSYAIYKLQENYDLIKNKIGTFTMGDVRVEILVDGKETDNFPSYESNYKIESVECDNDVTATFDVENWELIVSNLSAKSTKCIIKFNSKEINDITPISSNREELLEIATETTRNKTNEVLNIAFPEVYPVGSIYMSTTDDTVEKVQEKFGGTWISFASGTSLISANTTYPINTTGGNTTVNISHVHGSRGTLNGTLSAAIGACNSKASYLCYVATSSANNPSVVPTYIPYSTTALGSSDFTHWNHWTAVYGATSYGGSTALNIINPYTTVYMYKRTA